MKYTCVMHPQITVAEPGHCSICGMRLVPETSLITPREQTTVSTPPSTTSTPPPITAVSSSVSTPPKPISPTPSVQTILRPTTPVSQSHRLTESEINAVIPKSQPHPINTPKPQLSPSVLPPEHTPYVQSMPAAKSVVGSTSAPIPSKNTMEVLHGKMTELPLESGTKKPNIFPLILVLFAVLVLAIGTTILFPYAGAIVAKRFIINFMAFFFLIFGGFKLLDLKGFAQGYASYDLLAKRVPQYGYIYPFIEVLFGFAMLFYYMPVWLLWSEIILMTFSGVGVLIKKFSHEEVHCVCLGTMFKLPLTTVTLFEDFGMALFAFLLLPL